MALGTDTHCLSFNHTPSELNGIAPFEVFTSTVSDHKIIKSAHTWGSPVHVLEPRLTTAGGKDLVQRLATADLNTATLTT